MRYEKWLFLLTSPEQFGKKNHKTALFIFSTTFRVEQYSIFPYVAIGHLEFCHKMPIFYKCIDIYITTL